MQNHVPYKVRGRFMQTIFIGLVAWPGGWTDDPINNQVEFNPANHESGGWPVTAELPKEIAVIQHQTAGNACHHINLFGVFFKVNHGAPLLALEDKYYESQLGWGAVSWSALRELETDLVGHGLHMAHNEYQHLQEAFIPFDAESAFRYAREYAGTLTLPDGTETAWAELWPTYEDLRKHIADAYTNAKAWRPWPVTEGQAQLSKLLGCLGENLVGGFVFENCD